MLQGLGSTSSTSSGGVSASTSPSCCGPSRRSFGRRGTLMRRGRLGPPRARATSPRTAPSVDRRRRPTGSRTPRPRLGARRRPGRRSRASRASLRVVVIGAVLGPTYFGNAFQISNSLPNLDLLRLPRRLAGVLAASSRRWSGTQHADARPGAAAVAGGFLGLVLAGQRRPRPAGVLGLPLLLRLASVGSPSGVSRGRAGRAGAVLARAHRARRSCCTPWPAPAPR